MRSKFVILAFLLFSFFFSFSQSFHFGIKAGANINKLTGQSFSDQFSFGYHLGAFAEVGLGDKWSFHPEVLFSQVNVDTSNKFSQLYNVSNLSKINLRYLSIPIVLDYKMAKLVSIQVGPQFGILMDQNVSLIQNGKDAFKKGDFSLLAGVQVKFIKFRIYGRYVIGLNNLNDIDNGDKWKSQTVQLGVGFSIL